jgi:integrase
MDPITRPRVTRQIMPTLSETELNLLAAFLATAPLRDKAILCLFIDCAIRQGEAHNLRRQDILEDRIIIHGKTGYRAAPISGITRDLLLSLPAYEDGFVFHGADSHVNQRLGKTGIYKIVRKYLLVIGHTGKQFGPQILRRSFGRFWLRDGGDMKSLSIILGHKSVVTTDNYYTPLLQQDVCEIHAKHSPAAVFKEAESEQQEGGEKWTQNR